MFMRFLPCKRPDALVGFYEGKRRMVHQLSEGTRLLG
jgi:hypothetical protein